MNSPTASPKASADQDLVLEIRAGLTEMADPQRAAAMQAYMKSAMPFHGVAAPSVRRLCRTTYNAHRLGRAEWEATVRELFDQATHREERYAALALTSHRYYRDFQTSDALPLYRHLIATGAWWDIVDEVSQRVGDVLRNHPTDTGRPLRTWAQADDRWLRRTSIICQRTTREATDRGLLADTIVPNLSDPDFFIRKAIGWALREYAKTDPGWVRDFVAEHDHELSPLSRREAMKHLIRPADT